MQFQAPFRFDRSSFHATQALRCASVAGLFAVLTATVGCGSGLLGAGAAAPLNTAAPIASAKGPQLGYLWMASDKTLRPILGVTGASQVGQSVVPAGVYIGATASATASIAVLQDTDGALDLMTLPSGSPASLGLTLPVGARIRLSPAATSALLYTPGASSASLVTGLPLTPSVHHHRRPRRNRRLRCERYRRGQLRIRPGVVVFHNGRLLRWPTYADCHSEV